MRHGYVIVIAFGSLFSQINSKSGLIIAHLPRDIEQSESEITRATFFHVRIAAGHLSGSVIPIANRITRAIKKTNTKTSIITTMITTGWIPMSG